MAKRKTKLHLQQSISSPLNDQIYPPSEGGTVTCPLKWKPICNILFTEFFPAQIASPLLNSSAFPLPRHAYKRMSEAAEGKLQNDIRSCTSTGIGSLYFSIASNGKCSATLRAHTSRRVSGWKTVHPEIKISQVP